MQNLTPGVTSYVTLLPNSEATLDHTLLPLPIYPSARYPQVRLDPIVSLSHALLLLTLHLEAHCYYVHVCTIRLPLPLFPRISCAAIIRGGGFNLAKYPLTLLYLKKIIVESSNTCQILQTSKKLNFVPANN